MTLQHYKYYTRYDMKPVLFVFLQLKYNYENDFAFRLWSQLSYVSNALYLRSS